MSSTTAQVVPGLMKNLAIPSDTIVRRSEVDREDLKPYWKSEKTPSYLQVINNPIIYKFFKDFTNHRKKTIRVVIFSFRPFPKILKYREYQ